MKAEKTFIFLHVNKSTKVWLRALARKQKRYTSMSKMAAKIFEAAKKNSRLTKAA